MKARLDRIKVRVTQEHIEDGQPGNAQSCPVANAAFDRMEPAAVVVGKTTIYVADVDANEDGIDANYLMPDWVAARIALYDTTRSMVPFEFVATRIP